ncbi:ADP-ribosylation factor-like protein 15 isoform X2 [Nematostella vectensis]|uniref:ADP-ribosylation factor-like protein 15 isoform X2 n=1 Tax=Nematostella vectensis TaxID=45351 RepID=UPI00138FC335|nr:ADP-ribosylation factor-like protein 15 isoform X2 [Nematostella vectensis]
MSSKCECCGLLCAVLRIGCFRCCQKLRGKKPDAPRPEYSVLMIGLSGAGFSVKPVQLPTAILNVKELGGGDNVRKYWQHYFEGAQGVIFVVDSTSSEEDLELAASELQTALCHPALDGLPLLVLANQEDKDGARDTEEITRILSLNVTARGRYRTVEATSCDNINKTRDILTSFVSRIAGTDGEAGDDNRL